jgi:metal-responsive CopG/Arc/MetJ family transcriptional regulator
MKTAISVPHQVFEAAEQLAKRLGMSRSELYTTAVADFIERHGVQGVTERLNEVYGSDPELSKLDSVLQALQLKSMPKDEW